MITDYLIPLILFVTAVLALRRQENAYDLMLQGAAEGLKLMVSLVPALVLLLTAVHMLRASGAADLLSKFLTPVFSFFGIPPVMLGSTETTFDTIRVYFGAAGSSKTRYAVPAALLADFVGFAMASLTVRLLF